MQLCGLVEVICQRSKRHIEECAILNFPLFACFLSNQREILFFNGVLLILCLVISPTVELKKQISCSLQLSNKTDDHVAFKVIFKFSFQNSFRFILFYCFRLWRDWPSLRVGKFYLSYVCSWMLILRSKQQIQRSTASGPILE